MALASTLKKAELLVFYLIFGPVSIADKRFPQSRDSPLCFAPLNSLIFDSFALLNFYLPLGFCF